MMESPQRSPLLKEEDRQRSSAEQSVVEKDSKAAALPLMRTPASQRHLPYSSPNDQQQPQAQQQPQTRESKTEPQPQSQIEPQSQLQNQYMPIGNQPQVTIPGHGVDGQARVDATAASISGPAPSLPSFWDGISTIYGAAMFLDRKDASKLSGVTEQSSHVLVPPHLPPSLASPATFKLASDADTPDASGITVMDPAILSIDHTSSYPHHPGYSPVHQHAIAQYQHATTTLPPLAMGIHPPPASTTFPASAAGPVRRASAPRRRSKPYDPPATSSTSAQGNAPTIPSPTSPSAADDHLTSSSGITPPASQSTPLGGLPSGETKPLSDLENEIAQKRRRNTEAARRSRERKALRMQQLESQVAHLEAVNSQLSLKLAVVEKERAIFSAREQDLRRRVTNLETSLREAHEALMARAAASQAVQQDAEGDVRRAEAPGSQEQLHTISNVGELSNTAEVSS